MLCWCFNLTSNCHIWHTQTLTKAGTHTQMNSRPHTRAHTHAHTIVKLSKPFGRMQWHTQANRSNLKTLTQNKNHHDIMIILYLKTFVLIIWIACHLRPSEKRQVFVFQASCCTAIHGRYGYRWMSSENTLVDTCISERLYGWVQY